MIEIKAFKCEFCNKIFISNRHKCKYDPEKRNCYSCRHNMEFFKETTYDDNPYGGSRERSEIYVRCAKKEDPSEEDDIDCRYAKNIKCGDYEYCGGKWFENEHHQLKESDIDSVILW